VPGKRRHLADRLAAVASAGLCGGLQAALAYPAPDWLDSPELISAAVKLAPFHPPGSPLAVLAGHALSLWPFSPPTRTLLAFSALWAAVAVYLLIRIGQEIWAELGLDDRLGRLLVVPALGLAFGLGPGLMSQAVRTEVYTLGLVLSLAATGCLLRMALAPSLGPPDASVRLDRTCALTGMGLAVHPIMALAPVPGLVLLALTRRWRPWFFRPGRLARSATFGLLGAAPLFLLPLMTGAWQDLRWGDPRSLLGWFEYISGAAFAHTFNQPTTTPGGNGLVLALLLVGGLGWGLSLLAVLGAWLVLRTRPWAAGVLAGVCLATAPGLVLQRSVRLDNPDATGYALPALAALTLLAVGGLAVVARSLSTLGPRFRPLPLLLAFGLALWAAAGLPAHDHRACGRTQAALRQNLEALPSGTTILAADFNLAFMLDYLIRAEALRPDVVLLFQRDLDNPALRRALALSHPDLAARLPAGSRIGPSELGRLARGGPLAIDLGPATEKGIGVPTEPVGFLWLVGTPGSGGWRSPRPIPPDRPPAFDRGCPPSEDPRSAEVVAWHALWQSRAAAAEGRPGLARARIELAACASPLDGQVVATAKVLGAGAARCAPAASPAPAGTPAPHPPMGRGLVMVGGLALWAAGLLAPARKGKRRWLHLPASLVGLLMVVIALLQ